MAHIAADAAFVAVQAARDHAHSLGIHISAAVVDRSGHILALARDNAAPFQTASVAQDKACTAASFGAPTDKLGQALYDMGPMVFHGLLERPGMAAFGGGLPIVLKGERVGGIGVSGGTAEEDALCAQAGLEVIES